MERVPAMQSPVEEGGAAAMEKKTRDCHVAGACYARPLAPRNDKDKAGTLPCDNDKDP